jgi:beta-N-acetylhexosaminidase
VVEAVKFKLFLVFTIILLVPLTLAYAMEENRTINLSEMSLDEKIGQLMLVKPEGLNKEYLEELHVGGIFLNDLKQKENYANAINFYQDNSKIKLFIATDMEGYWNPFSDFYNSKNFGEINSKEESFNLGKEHGEILNEMGFNLDFSPIVEVRNTVWKGRSFTGSKQEVQEKISGYIKGLKNQSILSTAKHYPGGSMVKNPHIFKYKTEIFQEDLEYFDYAISQGVDFVMVGHPIVYGVIDSKGKQATVSPEVIKPLRKKFEGIIITDAVTMLGLRWSYLFNFKKVYPDLIIAGNDMILDTHVNSQYKKLVKRRDELKKAVQEGKLSQERIDESVKRILEIKGYEVLR